MGTRKARTSNCLRIEKYYGDLDNIYEGDRCVSLLSDLTYSTKENINNITPRHKIPIDGNKYTGTQTLRSALNLFIQFKENKLLAEIRTMPDIVPDEHDGSYEFVRETVNSLASTQIDRLDVPDLELLYFMAVGTWKGGVKFRLEKINKSSLPIEEKERLTEVFNRVVEKAKKHEYENVVGQWSVGMFGTGFYTFKSDKENAQKFLSLCIEINNVYDEDKALDIAEAALRFGIKGMQSAAASIILHCLKPNIFPIINNAMNEAAVLLEGEGVSLTKPGELTSYIKNARILKKYRDGKCKFKNYRALDIKFWDISDLEDEEEDEIESNTDESNYFEDIGITKSQWAAMLTDKNVFKEKDIELVSLINNNGVQATASELATITEQHPSSFNSSVVALAKRVVEFTNCTVPMRPNGKKRWWHVLFNGSYKDDGHFNWILRDELKEAFSEFQLEIIEVIDPYSKEDFLEEVFMGEEKYDQICGLLRYKKNIILQGAPGVGKTFIAKRLAYSMMNERDASRVEMVQFHQSYSYEDFIMGYRPEAQGFKLKYGIFYGFCEKAKNNPDREYYFIIDEINRGNLSKIFGELLMLIEADKRGHNCAVPLTYTEEKFYVPENLYIIGTMNTADRSLAMIDYALRRRFCFIEIEAAFNNLNFKGYIENKNNDLAGIIIDRISKLNLAIESDPSLGKGFCIGHSYFCTNEDIMTQQDYETIIRYEILPQLTEYWFDEPDKVREWTTKLLG